jgi:hypothetical protein
VIALAILILTRRVWRWEKSVNKFETMPMFENRFGVKFKRGFRPTSRRHFYRQFLRILFLNRRNFSLFFNISEITAKIFTGKNKRKRDRWDLYLGPTVTSPVFPFFCSIKVLSHGDVHI